MDNNSSEPLLSAYEDPSTSIAGYTVDRVADGDQELRKIISNSRRASVADEDYRLPRSQLYPVVLSLFTSTFLSSLDTTVVTTLLIDIASDLNAVPQVSWIATAYLLSCLAFQPLFGKLSDIFGRKILLVFCSLCFALGCLVCTLGSFIYVALGRFITGIGGGGLATLGTITMSDIIPLRKRGLFQGMTNIFYGIGAASGGAIGGVIADFFGWRSVFFVQIPFALLVGFLFWHNLNVRLGESEETSTISQKLKRIDFIGSIFLVLALVAIMSGAAFGGTAFPFKSLTFFGLVIAAIILLSAFTYTELYISPEPVIPVRLLADRTVLASSLANWFYSMSIFSYLFYIPIYYSSVLNFTAGQSGIRLIANFFGITCGSIGVGYYMKKTGKYYYFAAIMGLFGLLGMFKIYMINPDISEAAQYLVLFPAGAAYACMLTVTLLSLISSVPITYQASTTSIQYTFRSTGSTIGVSVASAVFQKLLKDHLTREIRKLVSPELAQKVISRALEDAKYVNEAPEIVRAAIRSSYGEACKGAFCWSLVTMFLGYVCMLLIEEHSLSRRQT